MKPKHLFAFLFATFQLFNFSTVFGQANTFWHDRIDTTIYATTTGTNTYTGTNTNTNFNVNKYVRGLLVSTFFVTGNTTAATYRLVTASGTLATAAIRKQNGAALVSGDIPDSSAVLLMYYGNFWRLMGVHAVSSSAWMLTGNAGTTAGTNFIGTTDAVGFVIKTNNTEWARMLSTGQLGLGTSTPISWLDIKKSANADTLFRASNDANSTFDSTVIILPNGRMGVGTDAPTARLHVIGPGNTSATNAGVYNNSSGTRIATLRDDGFVGINEASPVGVLHVADNAEAGSFFTSTGISRLNFRRTTADGISAGSLRYQSSDGTVKWSISTSLVIGADNLEFNAGALGNRMIIERTTGNIGLGAVTSWGTSAVGVIAVPNGTAPTTSPTDVFQFYSADISAGNAAFHTKAEGGEIYSIGAEFGAQSNNNLNLTSNGTAWATLTTDGRLYGTALHNNAGAVTGTTNQYIASGTYTPTITDSTNTSARTAYQSQWMRVGNVVTVSGVADVDPTLAATSTIIKITLPIASNFTATANCRGTAFCGDISAQGAAMLGTTTYASDFVLMKWVSGDITNQPMSYTFTYEVK